MEMESTRRSIDRSREPTILKKPRLLEETERDRRLNGAADRERAQARGDGGGSTLLARFRANERDRDTTVQQQQQQLQELVSQYKNALGELTFNSKPIITNLTIIAGENTHAAKGIAATVCQNILEVPSEQKLPSLYLLDSIVKNIGGDYVKCFAARLPEVFCKAYGQVDSSIHPGMQHLFRTWKGVFPPAPLQLIEEELDFPPATSSRSDSQSQRPAHSIHVNPKYLEARQKSLQQTSKAKGIGTDSSGSTFSEDAEQPERTAIVGGPKPWADLKMQTIQRPQREQLNEPVHEKKLGAGYGDYGFGSDRTRSSDLGIGRGERITEREVVEKPWYGLESSTTSEPVSQRNGYDMPQLDTNDPLDAYGNYRVPKPARAIAQLHSTQNSANKNSRGSGRNWKNSEEEEYSWDDMNSRLMDNGGSDSSRKDGWNADDVEKRASMPRGKWMSSETDLPDNGWNILDTASRLEKIAAGDDRSPLHREVEDHPLQPRGRQDIGSRDTGETSTDALLAGKGIQSAFGHRLASGWPSREPNLPPRGDSLNSTGLPSIISIQSEAHSRTTGLRPFVAASLGVGPSSFGSFPHSIVGSGGMFGHQRQQPQRPPSPSSQPPTHHHPHSPSQQPHNLIDHDLQSSQSLSQLGKKSSQFVGMFNQAPQIQFNQESPPIMPQNNIQPGTLRTSQVSQSQQSQHFHSAPSSLMAFPHGRPPISSQQTQPQPQPQPPNFATSQTIGYSGPSLSRNPSADLPGQSKTDNLLAAIFKSGLLPTQSSLVSNLPPLASNFPNPTFSDSSLQSHLNIQPPLPSGPPPIQLTSGSSLGPPLRSVQPPLPPGPPPASSMVGTGPQISNIASVGPNQLSSLLSDLVAKGLISGPATEASTLTPPEAQLQNQSTNLVTGTSMVASSSLASTSPPSSIKPPPESGSKAADPSQVTEVDINAPIGIELKPEIIRELHPLVITGLFDNLPHQCNICGLRFKQREQLNGHLDWHSSKKHERNSDEKISRHWYSTLQDWVDGNTGSLCGPVSITSVDETAALPEKCEPVVPADESQCICALCGEPFEDFYSEERDEWMYKGAVYMSLPTGESGLGSMDGCSSQGPIVHVKCLPRDSLDELGVSGYGSLDQRDG